MTLDNLLKTLDLAIHNKISEIDITKLKNQEVDILNAFFIEKEKHPELISSIQIPELIHDYLSLSLEERSQLEEFRKDNSEYLEGQGNGNSINPINNQNKVRKIAQKCCWTKQLLTFFDFYLKNHKEGEVFNPAYLKINKKLKGEFGNLGKNLYQNAKKSLKNEGDIQKIVELVAQERPEILEHWICQEQKKFDLERTVQDFIRIFEFYLENRKKSEVFNVNYLMSNKKLKNKLGNVGKNLYNNTNNNLKKEGGINKIVEIVAQERPEILKYWNYKKLNKFSLEKTVQDFIRIFEFYLKYRKEGEVFNSNYLGKNKKLKKRFGNLGERIYSNAYYNFQKEGGIKKIIKLAAQRKPKILEHWNYKEQKKFDLEQIVQDFIKIFGFYLEHRKEGEMFNAGYLRGNKKLKKEFGNLGKNLYQNAMKNLRHEGGIQKILELASQERPEIKEYSTFKGVLKIDGPKQLIRMFDFYLENHEEGQVFNSNYLKTNKQLRKEFGYIGSKLCDGVKLNLQKRSKVQKIVELASQERPEILKHWSHKRQNKFNINQATRDLTRMFDFYLRNRKEGQRFNSNYLQNNKRLKKKFKNLGENIYKNTNRYLKEEGGINKIVELIAKEKPNILKYWNYQKQTKFDLEQTVQDFIKIFGFYLEHRKEGEVFNSNYLGKNKKLKKRFGNLGERIYSNAYNNLRKEGGIQKILELASQQRPEIKQYTTVAEVLKIDGPKQLIRMFDFYLKNRKEGRVFNTGYLQRNKKFKNKFDDIEWNLCNKAYNNLRKEGGIQKILELASQQRPEIKEYSTFKGVLKIDGPKQLIRMFDFYLENREEGQVFNANYLQINKKLKSKFGSLGKNLYSNAKSDFKEGNGMQKIVELASQERPEILEQWSYLNRFNTTKAVQDFIKIFDFYLENHKEDKIFNAHYLQINKELKESFGNLGERIYSNAKNNLKKEGRVQKIAELASLQRPEIKYYWSYKPKYTK